MFKQKWVTINLFIGFKFEKFIEIGFESKIIKINNLTIALKYVHIARHSYY